MLGLAREDVALKPPEALIAWQVQGSTTRCSGARRPRRRMRRSRCLCSLCKHSRGIGARRRHAAGDMWGDCRLVFATRLGDPVDPRNFHRDFKIRVQKAGVPVVPIHSTRRTCASRLVALDVHPRVAMAVLRYSRIALTMEIYSQVSSTSTRDALKRLGGELSGC